MHWIFAIDAYLRASGNRRLKPAKWTRLDVIHRLSLAVTDSPLFKEEKLGFLLQIQPTVFLDIRPGTRLPRSPDRFEGVLHSIIEREGTDLVGYVQGDPLDVFRSRVKDILYLTARADHVFSEDNIAENSGFVIGATAKSLPPTVLEKQQWKRELANQIRLVDYELSASAAACYLLARLHAR